MFPVPEGLPTWLIAVVPVVVLAVLITNLAVRSRRGEFGRDAGGRRRAPWLWPVLLGVGAFVVLKLVTDR
ncbi:hypothetical protein [Quadrisphaera sp. KR29]|uniref:hypothetical protein n=1 Tax=Quadrisphaera sp. KR29 TaxID=3461391 RepID=UPI00404497C4